MSALTVEDRNHGGHGDHGGAPIEIAAIDSEIENLQEIDFDYDFDFDTANPRFRGKNDLTGKSFSIAFRP